MTIGLFTNTNFPIHTNGITAWHTFETIGIADKVNRIREAVNKKNKTQLLYRGKQTFHFTEIVGIDIADIEKPKLVFRLASENKYKIFLEDIDVEQTNITSYGK